MITPPRPGRTRYPLRVVATLPHLLVVALAAPLSAQSADRPPEAPRPVWIGLDFADIRPRGPLAEGGDDAFGFQLHFRYQPTRFGPVAMRLDAGLITHSQAVRPVCFPPPIGCRVGTDVVTALDIPYFGVGPEISAWNRRLYLFGTLGASSFETSSYLRGTPSEPVLFPTVHLKDVVLTRRMGAGIRLQPGSRASPWRIDLGVDYHWNGTAEYVRPEGIVDQPDGSITVLPDRSEANLLSVRLGVSRGFGGRREPSE